MMVAPIAAKLAAATVVAEHYLHRRPPISFAFGLHEGEALLGVVTFGIPASHHLCVGACRSDPALVLELNRLWVSDEAPRNTETWFLSRALRQLPPRIVVSYADTARGHLGYVYRAANFFYAGWTDMERKTPRYDYVVEGKHTRDAFRGGEAQWTRRVRRLPKVKYWTVTGSASDRRFLLALAGWPRLSWKTAPPPSA